MFVLLDEIFKDKLFFKTCIFSSYTDSKTIFQRFNQIVVRINYVVRIRVRVSWFHIKNWLPFRSDQQKELFSNKDFGSIIWVVYGSTHLPGKSVKKNKVDWYRNILFFCKISRGPKVHWSSKYYVLPSLNKVWLKERSQTVKELVIFLLCLLTCCCNSFNPCYIKENKAVSVHSFKLKHSNNANRSYTWLFPPRLKSPVNVVNPIWSLDTFNNTVQCKV